MTLPDLNSSPNSPNSRNEESPGMGLAARALTLLVVFYRKAISPLLPKCCRYTPTCSEYALEALKIHGAAYGSWLIFRRLLRCSPFGGSGYDPVPPKDDKNRFSYRHILYAVLFISILFAGAVGVSRTMKAYESRYDKEQTQKFNLPTRFLRFIVRFYQANMSGVLPGHCRMRPTCSTYGLEALEKHGALRGAWMTFVRVLKCNPWGPAGDDPVPDPK